MSEFSVLKCVQRIRPESYEPYYEVIVSTEIPVISIMDARWNETTAAMLAEQLGADLLKAIENYKKGQA